MIGFPLVLVEWVDSGHTPGGGWTALGELEASGAQLLCVSVGWLVSEANDCKVIVPHLSGREGDHGRQGLGDLAIPDSAIRKLVVLRRR